MTFDWPSIWTNIVSDFIFLIISIPIVIGLLPWYTLRLLRRRNKKHLVLKISNVILELCEFLSYSQYRDTILNAEYLAITTKKNNIKEFRHVALCSVNVFNKIICPKILIVIHETHKQLAPDKSYALLTEEFERLKEPRVEIERILSAHGLYLEEIVILKISDLCFQIRKLELDFKNNLDFQQLAKALNKEEYSNFGQTELPRIYQTIFNLIKDLLIKEYFDYTLTYPTK